MSLSVASINSNSQNPQFKGMGIRLWNSSKGARLSTAAAIGGLALDGGLSWAHNFKLTNLSDWGLFGLGFAGIIWGVSKAIPVAKYWKSIFSVYSLAKKEGNL